MSELAPPVDEAGVALEEPDEEPDEEPEAEDEPVALELALPVEVEVPVEVMVVIDPLEDMVEVMVEVDTIPEVDGVELEKEAEDVEDASAAATVNWPD